MLYQIAFTYGFWTISSLNGLFLHRILIVYFIAEGPVPNSIIVLN